MYSARANECCVVFYTSPGSRPALLAVLKVEMGELLINVLDRYAEDYAFDRERLTGDFICLLEDWKVKK